MKVMIKNQAVGRQRLAKTMIMAKAWHRVVDIVNSLLDGRSDSIVDVEIDASVTTSGAVAGRVSDNRVDQSSSLFLESSEDSKKYYVDADDGEIVVKRV